MKPFESATDVLSDNAVGSALGKVDLGATISSMGIGIAKAQQALDNNSINQLLALKSPQDDLAGRSLLEMGFIPAFYHFQSATLSASVALSMEVSQETEFGLDVDVNSNSTMSKSNTYGKQKIRNTTRDIKFSKDKVRTVNTTKMRSIYDYSESNNDTDDYLLLADKVKVTEFSGFSASTDSRAQINSEAGIVVVSGAPGKRWAVWKFTTDPGTNKFPLYHGPTESTAQTGTFLDKLKGLKAEAESPAKGANIAYILGEDGDPLREIFFDHNSYEIRASEIPKLIALKRIMQAASISTTNLTAHTDGSGKVLYNTGLSQQRGEAVRKYLNTNPGPVATGVTINAEGETLAAADTGEARNQEYRRVDIAVSLPSDTYYLYLEETAVDKLNDSPSPVPTDGYLSGAEIENTANITNGSTTYTATSAADLATEINKDTSSGFQAEAIGDTVHIIKSDSSDYAEVEIFARKEKDGFKHAEQSFSLEGTARTSKTKSKTSEKKVNRTTAVGVSVNARYSRQFNVSMSGNCSITAEMVALPPPEAFLTFIQSLDDEG